MGRTAMAGIAGEPQSRFFVINDQRVYVTLSAALWSLFTTLHGEQPLDQRLAMQEMFNTWRELRSSAGAVATYSGIKKSSHTFNQYVCDVMVETAVKHLTGKAETPTTFHELQVVLQPDIIRKLQGCGEALTPNRPDYITVKLRALLESFEGVDSFTLAVRSLEAATRAHYRRDYGYTGFAPLPTVVDSNSVVVTENCIIEADGVLLRCEKAHACGDASTGGYFEDLTMWLPKNIKPRFVDTLGQPITL